MKSRAQRLHDLKEKNLARNQMEFISALREAEAKLETLREALGDHLGFDPDNINGAHVGTMRHICSQLDEILARGNN